ncbi:MAG: hypothetical protein ACRELD_14300, partial [Longimicrobiales bacterium]
EPASAADMGPDDLWELLTGERRRRAPEPRPAPEPPRRVPAKVALPRAPEAEPEPSYNDVAIDELQYDQDRRLARSEARSLEAITPPEYPEIVSLETEPLPAERRHTLFHERLDASALEVQRATPLTVHLGLDSARDVRRAFVLREILGPPRALDEEAAPGYF